MNCLCHRFLINKLCVRQATLRQGWIYWKWSTITHCKSWYHRWSQSKPEFEIANNAITYIFYIFYYPSLVLPKIHTFIIFTDYEYRNFYFSERSIATPASGNQPAVPDEFAPGASSLPATPGSQTLGEVPLIFRLLQWGNANIVVSSGSYSEVTLILWFLTVRLC